MNAHWIFKLYQREDGTYRGASQFCSNCCCGSFKHVGFYPSYEYYCHGCGAHMTEEPEFMFEDEKTTYSTEILPWE